MKDAVFNNAATAKYNPFVKGNQASEVQRYSAICSNEVTMSTYNLNEKELEIIKRFNPYKPELVLSYLSNCTLSVCDTYNHITTKIICPERYYYYLDDKVFITEQDFNALCEKKENIPSTQMSFDDLLYHLTKYQQSTKQDFVVNYARDTMLVNEDILKYYKQDFVKSEMSGIIYHFFPKTKTSLTVTRLYKGFLTYQQFKI